MSHFGWLPHSLIFFWLKFLNMIGSWFTFKLAQQRSAYSLFIEFIHVYYSQSSSGICRARTGLKFSGFGPRRAFKFELGQARASIILYFGPEKSTGYNIKIQLWSRKRARACSGFEKQQAGLSWLLAYLLRAQRARAQTRSSTRNLILPHVGTNR